MNFYHNKTFVLGLDLKSKFLRIYFTSERFETVVPQLPIIDRGGSGFPQDMTNGKLH